MRRERGHRKREGGREREREPNTPTEEKTRERERGEIEREIYKILGNYVTRKHAATWTSIDSQCLTSQNNGPLVLLPQ